MGFTEVLTLIFITLKLTGYISWSWFYVLLPTIISLSIVFGVFLLYMIYIGFGGKVKITKRKK